MTRLKMENAANNLENIIADYLKFCEARKNLNKKTIKCYSIDLTQFDNYILSCGLEWHKKHGIEDYIEHLHEKYKPKSVKRKLASLKAFFHYLEIEEIIEVNPFHKIQIKYKEPFILPRTIPLHSIEKIIKFAYHKFESSTTDYAEFTNLRNVVILELLFATGMRISELCSLTFDSIDMNDCVIKIYGKGSRERLIQICNPNVRKLLVKYYDYLRFTDSENNCNFLFLNRLGNRLSEQSVRNMIANYAEESGISQHITPHMFRHSFATLLLEEDVDIRYIQQMLGHSSITTTQIYTHISTNKQKSILSAKHPRNKFDIGI